MLQGVEEEHDSERKDPPVWNIVKRNMGSQIVALSVSVANDLSFGLA